MGPDGRWAEIERRIEPNVPNVSSRGDQILSTVIYSMTSNDNYRRNRDQFRSRLLSYF